MFKDKTIFFGYGTVGATADSKLLFYELPAGKYKVGQSVDPNDYKAPKAVFSYSADEIFAILTALRKVKNSPNNTLTVGEYCFDFSHNKEAIDIVIAWFTYLSIKLS